MAEDVHSISSGRVTAADVVRHSFETIRKGYDPQEVRAYLELLARELRSWEQREQALRQDLEAAEERARNPVLDESTLSAALGQKSASILRNAHDEGARIAQQAEEEATALVREAQAHAAELRVGAEAHIAERIAEAEIAAGAVAQQAQEDAARLLDHARVEGERVVEQAREQGQALIDEAQDTRRRVLADMAHRRRAMTLQIEQFRAARDELASSVMGLRGSVDRVLADLAEADDRARAAAAEVARREGVEVSRPTPDTRAEVEAEAVVSVAPTPTPLTSVTQTPTSPTPTGDDAGSTDRPDDAPAVVDEVEDLFARLRASRSVQPEGGTTESGVDPGGSTDPGEPTGQAPPASPLEAVEDDAPGGPVGEPQDGGGDADERVRVRCAEMLDPVVAKLARRTKRALQDDQNRLLDRLRSGSGSWSDAVLPAEAEQRLAYVEAVSDLLGDAFRAGRELVPGSSGDGEANGDSGDSVVTGVAERLAGSITALLRRKLADSGSDGDEGAAADRIGAAYREWRGERVERTVGDAALEAFCSGVLSRIGPDTELRWVVGGSEPPCADCDDNALAGAIGAGQGFPTGHLHPPAHPGCRCLVVPLPD
jgi:DivIVA domain-containing protein